MNDDLITSENLTKDLLRSIFDAAMMEVSLDGDGDVRVKENFSCWVLPSDKRDRIKLLSLFGFVAESTRVQRLECVNKINAEYIVARAVVGDTNDALRFDHDVILGVGIARKSLVMIVKRFLAILGPAITEYGKNIVK